MRYLIADLVVEYTAKYDELKFFSEPFIYNGDAKTDIYINVSDERIENALNRAVAGTAIGDIESFLISSDFNRAAIKHQTMLIHSSAVIYNGGAYLFSANSGVGKSTHTRFWLKAFGDKVHIMNDDKPVVRIVNGNAIAYGTPFDGGSGFAFNESAPLKAIVFIERGEENSVRIPDTTDILKKLYFSTVHMVDRETANAMLNNFSELINTTKFYILTCNMDISAAYTAFNSIVEK